MEMYQMEVENHIENHEMVWKADCPKCGRKADAPIKYGKYVCTNSKCKYEFMVMVTKWREIREEI